MWRLFGTWHMFEWLICLFFLSVGIVAVFFAPAVHAWYIAFCEKHSWYLGLMPGAFKAYVLSPWQIWSYRMIGAVSLIMALLTAAVLLHNTRHNN